jgi:hypothetical protein
MEASKFGFDPDTPAAFKFDPTDADLVAHYLLPRALGLHNPHAHAIIEEDPGSVPPWEILKRHGHVANPGHPVHAFFFGPPVDASQNAGRKNRSVQGGGTWQGQKGSEDTVTLLRPGGGEVDIRFKRYNLTFYLTKGGATTGYVMHEYEILSPPLPGTVLTRIKAGKDAQWPPDAEADGAVAEQHAVLQVPGPSSECDAVAEQHAVLQVPGPSSECDAAANGEELAAAQDGALCDSDGFYCAPLRYALPDFFYENSYHVSVQDQSATSYNPNAAAMMNNGEEFTVTGAHGGAFYGGRTVDCIPERGYGQYQQWHYQQDLSNQHQQQDPSNQYQAGDAAVMCAGGEGFTGEQQTGAPCGNRDNGSVVGTEKTTPSTISLCRDGDGTTFYNALFGVGDEDK